MAWISRLCNASDGASSELSVWMVDSGQDLLPFVHERC